MDAKLLHRIDGLSKLTTVEDLRKLLVDKFEAQPEQQRLFYRGKQVRIRVFYFLASLSRSPMPMASWV